MGPAASLLQATVEDIRAMRVRGAAPIAVAAAKALAAHVAAAQHAAPNDLRSVQAAGRQGHAALLSSRPTAVSLRHGLAPVLAAVDNATDAAEAATGAQEAARRFAQEVKASEEAIARLGAAALGNGERILTHCHSSTVVAVLARAQQEGKAPEVIATETRPFRQGLTTARWLREADVATTLVVDSAALHLLRTAAIDRVLVGADTVTADGSLFNKIGTSQVALAARSEEVPFWSCASWIKFSPQAPDAVVVEERDPDEVVPAADLPPGAKVMNPVFDRTPPEHLAGFFTESGPTPGRKAVADALRRLAPEVRP